MATMMVMVVVVMMMVCDDDDSSGGGGDNIYWTFISCHHIFKVVPPLLTITLALS